MFIVSEEQAARIKRRWWWLAKLELKAWLLVAVVGTVLGASALKHLHWPWWQYAALYGASLLVFSRLVWWITFPTVMLANLVCPNWAVSHIINALILAAVVRCPFFWWFLGSVLRAGTEHGSPIVDEGGPVGHDPVTGRPRDW